MRSTVDGEWKGWDGKTVVKLVDGSTWEQAEYLYEYVYSYRPGVTVENNLMRVDGMSRAVKIRRVR